MTQAKKTKKFVYTTQTVQDMLLRATLCMPHLRLAAEERGFNGTSVSESSRVLAFLHAWLALAKGELDASQAWRGKL